MMEDNRYKGCKRGTEICVPPQNDQNPETWSTTSSCEAGRMASRHDRVAEQSLSAVNRSPELHPYAASSKSPLLRSSRYNNGRHAVYVLYLFLLAFLCSIWWQELQVHTVVLLIDYFHIHRHSLLLDSSDYEFDGRMLVHAGHCVTLSCLPVVEKSC